LCLGKVFAEFDIRLPIALLFSLIGLLLTAFGLLGDKEIYTNR
jgi:hypothetical protein